jgi:anti-sigma regulatory factor (Ser/Thr protein kinase)
MTASGLVHEALFYRNDDEYVAGTVDFLRAGLDVDEPSLVAVPSRNGDLIRSGLGVDAVHIRFLNMAEAGRNPGRIIPGVLHAFVSEHIGHRVRIIGEPIWAGRSGAEYPACVQHEALINIALGDSAAWILCPYDTEALPAEMIDDAYRTHPVLVDRDNRWLSRNYSGAGPVVSAYNRPFPEPDESFVSLTFDALNLSEVRSAVIDQAVLAGLLPDRMDDLQIAVNEVATNAVTHSDGPGRLRVWRESDRVVCEIASPGRLVNPLAGRIPPEPDSENGRGLLLVNYLCDLVRTYTDDEQTVLRLDVRR